MKLKVGNRDYTDEKIIMKTSIRAGCYSIRFEKLGEFNGCSPEFWGHLNKIQARKMINDLGDYIKL